MGLIDAVFGGGSESSPNEDDAQAEQKYAILLNAGPEDGPVAANGFNYAVELDDAGYEVRLFLDGKATKWPAAFAEDPDRPFSYDWEKIQEHGLLAGACGYCANAFDVAEACQRSEVQLLSDKGEHAPAVAQLAEEGYEIMTVG